MENTIPHPQSAGFTPRFEWHGRVQVIVWRHCETDAADGSRWVRGTDGVHRNVRFLRCLNCGLKWNSEGTV
jgi:hypothetical protein